MDNANCQVFISYASEDKAIVQEIYKDIDKRKEQGINFFIDTEMTANLVGKSKSDYFYNEIHKSKLIILFISRHYVIKENTIYECTVAHNYYKETDGKFIIIPVSLDGTVSKILSSDLLYLDFQRFSYTDFLKNLNSTIKENLSLTFNALGALFKELNQTFVHNFSSEHQVVNRIFFAEYTRRYEIITKFRNRKWTVIITRQENKISITFDRLISGFNDTEISIVNSDIEGQFKVISLIVPELIVSDDLYNIKQCLDCVFSMIRKRFNQDW